MRDWVSPMRTPRKLIPIPLPIAAGIEKIAGYQHRNAYIVAVLDREIRRHEQLEALNEAAGSWKNEDHSELAHGSDAWVRQMRQESEKRFERLEQQRDGE